MRESSSVAAVRSHDPDAARSGQTAAADPEDNRLEVGDVPCPPLQAPPKPRLTRSRLS
jgi:hypothetical protein